uniref:Anaphase-promoting complex subunit 4 WD40 domain-containing protein n=2 Tax=Hemiselmis andersenii TaxID=464988 RepID=A0A7S1DJ60_HEMAN|mmetsp:Transcript_14252/g.34719  ORF Transcript_14252/g.34719 Transcript_14252/m.34719 type:complete len:345 (+) Transcript_14252:112-1146(+)|eukprot:CAMPEP_0114165114 /NCGR_PEP_ID=MMETSP0043_2-20121206/31061_1 /TAXON_ID=464988 /ORGANISM="Hemiselmis andersenii, Strain CCMP644" /LENGTH=344 /DNA_ID=CAMNT_0001261885 /DNA_START=36 /DNA_END=1070 /DNA_ORIENTATION=-
MPIKVIRDPKKKIQSHNNWVKSVAYSPDGQFLATASTDKTVKCFEDGKELFKVQHPDWVWHVCFSYTARRKRIATACLDGIVRILEATTGRVVKEITGHTGTVNCCAFAEEGETIVSVSYDHTAKIFNVGSGKLIHNIEYQCPVLSVAVSSTGTAFTGDTSGTIKEIDVKTGKVLGEWKAHRGHIEVLALSASGDFLASGGGDECVIVWRKESGKGWVEEQTMIHFDVVNSVAFSPDDSILGAASDNGAQLFEVGGEWEEQANIEYHQDQVNGLSFFANGPRLTVATASDDKSVCLWDLSPVSVALKVLKAKRAKEGKSSRVSDGGKKKGEVTVGDRTDMDGID